MLGQEADADASQLQGSAPIPEEARQTAAMSKTTPALLKPAEPEDLVGIDLFLDDGTMPAGLPVEEVVARIEEEVKESPAPDIAKAEKLGALRSALAYQGVLLLKGDIDPLKETRMREFLALVGAGYTDHEAATAVGYSRWAPVHWKRSQPGFMEAYNHAKHVNVDALITEAKRRALRGSDRLLEFLLCNLASEQFKRTDSQRVDVNVNLADRLTAGRRRAGG